MCKFILSYYASLQKVRWTRISGFMQWGLKISLFIQVKWKWCGSRLENYTMESRELIVTLKYAQPQSFSLLFLWSTLNLLYDSFLYHLPIGPRHTDNVPVHNVYNSDPCMFAVILWLKVSQNLYQLTMYNSFRWIDNNLRFVIPNYVDTCNMTDCAQLSSIGYFRKVHAFILL